MKRERETIVNRGYYKVYYFDGSFFVETGRYNYAVGFDTLDGVKEFLYYQGFIDSKTAEI